MNEEIKAAAPRMPGRPGGRSAEAAKKREEEEQAQAMLESLAGGRVPGHTILNG